MLLKKVEHVTGRIIRTKTDTVVIIIFDKRIAQVNIHINLSCF